MCEELEELQERLGRRFADPSLLGLALTHASVRGRGGRSNERLEFLGDAVLALVVSRYLFALHPPLSEGQMTKVKSPVVSRRTLAEVGNALGLAQFLHVDDGLKKHTRYPASMVAGAYEAVVGALFLDGGLEAAREFVLRTLGPELERVQARRHTPNYKAMLQERLQAESRETPAYVLSRWEGPDHQRRYHTTVHVAGRECGSGCGRTKKEAEQDAARSALQRLYPDRQETAR